MKYEPKTWDEWIGNPEIKENFQHKTPEEMINTGFFGPPGVGKTLGFKLLGKINFGGNYFTIKVSQNSDIKTIVDRVVSYCETTSIGANKIKFVVLQEFDGVSKQAQKKLRIPMEEYMENVKFGITANYPEAIIDAHHSRGCMYKLRLGTEEELREFAKRIIDGEHLEISESQLSGIIKESRGQFRKVANIINGRTTKGRVHYKTTDDLEKKSKMVFNLIKKKAVENSLDMIEEMIQSDEEKTILNVFAGMIRDDDTIPKIIKMKFLIEINNAYRDIVGGNDTYITFWSLVSKLVLIINSIKRK